jgi:peptide/nickel transport system ATP-binding protein
MSLLEVADLSLSIGAAPVLRGVSLTVAPGEVFGLIGESGSGKSMTALAVMGLAPEGASVRGRVTLAGTDLTALSERRMCAVRGAGVGMVFQEPMTALNPVHAIGDQVAETVRVHTGASRAEARATAAAVLERVGLPASRFPPARYPHELSGGQRQRVGIAMAIALRPKLLIADEPTTALDVTTQARILLLLRRLVDEDGMGLMLITHDLGVVAGIADNIAVMRDGAVVEAGGTAAVFERRAHPYTQELFAAATHAPVRAPHAPGRVVLDVREVVRDYATPRAAWFGGPGRFRAVDGVSLTVARGETVALVGESGCGKSTLTRAILGLEPVQGGEIILGGAPVDAARGVPRAVRRRVQAVFQDPYGSFNPRHRVARLVAEPLHLLDDPPRGAARDALVAQALEQVGLRAGDGAKYIHEFSGGQRQRIAIARALIIAPELIVLDEAVSALDVSIRAQILDLLADLSARLGLAYLFIAHDLGVVRAIADRVLVMQAGRIVEEGGTGALFAAPRHAYTRTLLDASPDIAAGLRAHRERAGSG